MKKIIKKLIPQKLLDTRNEKIKAKGINIYTKQRKNKKILNPLKVSVIVPSYNYEKYINERIDSILFQTYPIYEFIILDDCSKDQSVKIIKEKIEKEKLTNIKLIENKKNSGNVFSQWKKGFSIAKGDIVWIAEADDSCDPYFLENVIKGFDDKDVVLSYCESMRIDENNKIIHNSCRDYMLCASDIHWNKSYINNGNDEVTNYMSICNTIPNVSAVLWKNNKKVCEYMEEAKQYTMSGDWYIYQKILKNKKIVYCSKSLNYFRKHKESASTIAKKEIEVKELLKIQQEIRNEYFLSSIQMFRQSYRYGNILDSFDDKTRKKFNHLIVKKIAWIMPHPIKGSGGIRTMVMNANFLVKKGYICDIYVEEDYVTTKKSLYNKIKEYYGECLCDVYVGIQMQKNYDMIFSTYSILTPDYAQQIPIKRKAYFIQDFEPWFVPMGERYLRMERTYKYKFEGISIGHWLAHKLNSEYGASMNCFDFCADINIYKKLNNVKKEDAVCFIFQPEKARRCSKIGLEALMLVKKLRPNVKIYLYGSNTSLVPFDFVTENLNIIPIEECNKLYNKCKVGLCISASNPSRIPFEMMAAGLPVVDMYRENNLYDIPDSGVLLADSTPEGLATAIIKILDDSKLQEKMSKNGSEYMKNFSLEKGFEQFLKFVDDYMNDKLNHDLIIKKTYNKKPILPSQEVLDNNDIISPFPVVPRNTSNFVRKIVGIKKKIKGER